MAGSHLHDSVSLHQERTRYFISAILGKKVRQKNISGEPKDSANYSTTFFPPLARACAAVSVCSIRPTLYLKLSVTARYHNFIRHH